MEHEKKLRDRLNNAQKHSWKRAQQIKAVNAALGSARSFSAA